ncbi:MAG: hypothetical protein MZV63_33820 [Marinilabiliales bacterium]|nr:hypothetical protein [Marinilabiliales bacterium]
MPGVPIGGKTGTAQVVKKGDEKRNADAEGPRLVRLVRARGQPANRRRGPGGERRIRRAGGGPGRQGRVRSRVPRAPVRHGSDGGCRGPGVGTGRLTDQVTTGTATGTGVGSGSEGLPLSEFAVAVGNPWLIADR